MSVEEDGSRGFIIVGENGETYGHLITHLEGKTVVVDYVAGKTGEDYENRLGNVGLVRQVARALKKEYPQAEKVSGVRITGVHYRKATERWRRGKLTRTEHEKAVTVTIPLPLYAAMALYAGF